MRLIYSRGPLNSLVSQQGMVLVVGLVMVLLLSIIGLAAIRGSGLQENMAFNMRDRNVAFQAADSALRVCEENVAMPNVPEPNCVAGGGSCEDLDANPATSPINSDAWMEFALNVGLNIPDVARQPTCLVEVMRMTENEQKKFKISAGEAIGNRNSRRTSSAEYYRVDAQGVGDEQSTQVVVQSTVVKRFIN